MSATEVHSPSRDAAVGKADMHLEVEIIPVSNVDRSRQFYERLGWGEGRPVVAAVFGPNGQRVLALMIRIPGLTAGQVDRVTGAWKRGDPRGRAHALAKHVSIQRGRLRRSLASDPGR